MKKTLFTLIAAAALLLASNHAAQAQTATNPPASTASTPTPAQNFFDTTKSWLTSLNPDNTWTNVTLELGIGYSQVTGDPAASVVDAQYDIGKFNLGANFQYFGLGSSVNEAEFQAGYAVLEKEDLKVDVDLRVGYDFISNDEAVEPALMLKKKLTTNTYAQVGVSLPFEFKRTFSRNPTFFVETGCTF